MALDLWTVFVWFLDTDRGLGNSQTKALTGQMLGSENAGTPFIHLAD